MEDLLHIPGLVEVVLGRGSLTAYEVSRLRPGTVIAVSDTACGDPSYLFFNQHLVGYVDVAVIEGRFCARVRKISWNTQPLPFAGEADDLTEFLESRIRLASVPFTLQDLQGLGRYGVIDLGRPHQWERNAELLVAGVPVAMGTVCIHGEQWALRVDEVLRGREGATGIATSGSIVNEPALRLYDFTRPDRFSRDEIRSVALIHERFAANLRELSGALNNCHVRLVDQMTYGELLETLPVETACVIAHATLTTRGEGLPPGRKYFVQGPESGRALAKEKVEAIEREARRNETGSPFESLLFFCRPGGSFAGLFEREELVEVVLTLLRNAWKQRVRMPPLTGRSVKKEDWEAEVPRREMILVAKLTNGPDDDALSVVYPAIALEKIGRFLR